MQLYAPEPPFFYSTVPIGTPSVSSSSGCVKAPSQLLAEPHSDAIPVPTGDEEHSTVVARAAPLASISGAFLAKLRGLVTIPLFASNSMTLNPKPTESQTSHFERILRGMSFIKDLLEIILKVSPLALVAPAMTVWLYLRKLGWSELFGESVGSLPGLLALLVGSILILIVFLLQVVLPSIFFGAAAEVLDDERPNPRLASARAQQLHFVPVLMWQLCFSVSVAYFPDAITSPLQLATAVSAVTAAAMAAKFREDLLPASTKQRITVMRQGGNTAYYLGYCALLMGVGIAFPIVISVASAASLLSLWWLTKDLNITSPAAFVVLCCGAGAISVVPGLAYLGAKVERHPPRKLWLLTALAGGGVLYAAIATAMFFAPISRQSFELAGVSDTQPHVYLLQNESILPSIRAVGIPTSSTKEFFPDGKEAVFVGAYLQFNFGGVKLLCRSPYDAVDPAVSITADAQRDLGSRSNLGGGCLPVRPDDVRVVRPHR